MSFETDSLNPLTPDFLKSALLSLNLDEFVL